MDGQRFLRKNISSEDILILHGGGNIGNEYLYSENIRRSVIRSFPQNPIVVFPQTVYFTDSLSGKKELKKSINTYKRHKKLCVFLRDEQSYIFARDVMKLKDIQLVPDIVTYLNGIHESMTRSNTVLLCIRSDKEGVLTYQDIEHIRKSVFETHSEAEFCDTCAINNILPDEREKNLMEIWEKFRASKLVITDRIHGMLFCAITSTPCIALGNYNHKVLGAYSWMKELDYIKFAHNADEAEAFIKSGFYSLEYPDYDRHSFDEYYKNMLTSILNLNDKIKIGGHHEWMRAVQKKLPEMHFMEH